MLNTFSFFNYWTIKNLNKESSIMHFDIWKITLEFKKSNR